MNDETNATDESKHAAAAVVTQAEEAEDVMLLYVDEESNPGPGQFVMHGVNLFFRRGALTGPVTATVAGIVIGRNKQPAIRIASAEEVKALQPSAEKPVDASEEKSGGNSEENAGDNSGDNTAEKKDAAGVGTTTTDAKSGDSAGDNTGSGTTAPADPKPDASPATERKPKPGAKLTTG
jgi:hypothetical protein